ncbi:hypothetical protein [Microbacterium arabinogalactanolyticum]|uniref:hypothetical protein n=1 Tax=Microbacterium arabinogalactanolyticum TaxID=69365 RepID=UPI0025572AEC|nr:hypothetical protein [Microbacterium arabinogalactanolyticum]GLC86078.1 hypothetical protein MIAR_26640 [Microbacterium arabinogalactanolyticum]
MARPKKRFKELLEEIDRTPWGPAEQALVGEAVALAQEIGDEQLEYQARMRQTASANMGGLTDVMLNSFAWCLAHHDADPKRFPLDIENGAADLMWQFKWMAASLRGSPAFSAEQVAAVLDDMEAHYVRAGLGMSGVLTARFEDAWDSGRFDDAEALRVQLETTPRDDYSHCDACGRSQFAGFFAETDRDDEAIRLVEEMLEGGFSCGEEPEHALSRVLLPYLRAGRPEEARSAHLRSYRLAKDNPDNLVIVANNLVFAAVTGNEARALALVERHLPWLAHDQLNVDGHFTALSAIGFALDRVTEAGHGDARVRGADSPALTPFFGAHEGPWTASELAAAANAAAERIGAAFDERDGTDAHAARLARTRALSTQRWDVPIRSDAFAAAPAAPEPQDAEGWYDRAVALGSYGSETDALAAAARASELADPEKRARLLGLRIGALVSLERWDEASALLPERAAALDAAGLTEQVAVEGRLGLALFGRYDEADVSALEREWADAAGLPAWTRGDLALTLASARLRAEDSEGALQFAEHAARAFGEAGDDRLVAGTTLLAIMTLLRSGDLERASALVDGMLAEETLNPGQRARVLETRARIRGGAGELADGAADADAAAGILASLGGSQSLASTQMLAGALWEDAGDAEQAVLRYRSGVRLIEQEGGDVAGARYRLGRAMLHAGYAAEAAELLGDVLRAEEEAEVPAGSRAITVGMLARSLAASEEFGQAVGAFGYAADLHEQADEPADQALMLTEQAKILARFGEGDDARGLLEQAAELVRPTEATGAIVEVLHNLGQAYGGTADERAFGLFDEVATLAQENDAPWLLADVTDSRGRALVEFGRIDEAISALLTAADGFAGIGDAGSAGGSELFAARTLVNAERLEDAVPLYRSVLDRSSEIPPLRQVGALELGDVLEKLGRAGEAAQVRALIED